MIGRKQKNATPPPSLDQRPIKTGALYLLALGLALAIIPHALHAPIWISAVSLTAIAARLALARRGVGTPPRGLLMLLALAGAVGVIAQFGTFVGREAGVAGLVLMIGLKFLENRGMRDAMLTCFLGYFVVITHFFVNQDIPVTIYLVTAVLTLTAAMIALSEGEGRVPMRVKFKSATLLLLQSLPIMLVLFFLFPRIAVPLWGVPRDQGAAISGLSDEMSPGEISRLIQSEATAFRASFEGPIPPADARYWRGPVLWDYDGRTWRAPVRPPGGTPALEGRGTALGYAIILEPHHKRWLLALDMPLKAPPGAHLGEARQVLADKPVHEIMQYKLQAHTDYRLGRTLSLEERRLALALPVYSAPRARTLARQWRMSLPNNAAIVATALHYFREQPFAYTLTPPRLIDDPVDAFLFDTRRGFCEHYASSFVVLMRAAGIPARVVTGYLGGEYNPIGDYLLIRQADAHAWSEVWLEDQGWVRIDPTAAVAPERVELGLSSALGSTTGLPAFLQTGYSGSWLNRANLLWDMVNFHWNDWVLSYGPEKQAELLSTLGLDRFGWRGVIIAMSLLILLIVLVYALIFTWRARPPAQDPVLRIYTRYCEILAGMGLPRAAHEGPLSYAKRAGAAFPALAGDIRALTQAYTAHRYADRAQTDLHGLRQHLRTLRTRARSRRH